MDGLKEHLEELRSQLAEMAGQIQSAREKLALATPAGNAAMAGFIEQWEAAEVQARRKLAELEQEGAGWREHLDDTEKAWAGLRAIVESAKAAF